VSEAIDAASGKVPEEKAAGEKVAGKNIVICCDGTGNQVSGNLSNVLKLFRIAKKDEGQRVFYDPGVGTVGTSSDWEARVTKVRALFGLATGAGLDTNVLEAYSFLCQTYAPGDRIYLFGFSRGAYTARELAALVHMVGLLKPDQLNLCEYALTAYKRAGWHSEDEYDRAKASGDVRPEPVMTGGSGERGERSAHPEADPHRANDFAIAWDFGKVTQTRRATIHFMGCWDTVASMIVPGPKLLSLPRLRTLPYTRVNPSVRAFRHAMAIDERRRMFRLNWWKEGQTFVENPFTKPRIEYPQDCEQLWFPGVHSDVGGGYPEEQSSLSKWPLIWMVEEAVKHGLEIDNRTFRRLAWGERTGERPSDYPPPNMAGPMHRSLKGLGWWLIEYLPKSTRWREWRHGRFGFYLPRGEPRVILKKDQLHHSAQERFEAQTGPGQSEPRYAGCDYPPYRPVNLVTRPDAYLGPEPRTAQIMRRGIVAVALLGAAGLAAWPMAAEVSHNNVLASELALRDASSTKCFEQDKPTVQLPAPSAACPAARSGSEAQALTAPPPGLSQEQTVKEISTGAGPYVLSSLSSHNGSLTRAGATALLRAGIDSSTAAVKARRGLSAEFQLLNGKFTLSSPAQWGPVKAGSAEFNLYKGAAIMAPALVYCYENRSGLNLKACVTRVVEQVTDKSKQAAVAVPPDRAAAAIPPTP
jgi:uncharacterized protein (DUF2235 family)